MDIVSKTTQLGGGRAQAPAAIIWFQISGAAPRMVLKPKFVCGPLPQVGFVFTQAPEALALLLCAPVSSHYKMRKRELGGT